MAKVATPPAILASRTSHRSSSIGDSVRKAVGGAIKKTVKTGFKKAKNLTKSSSKSSLPKASTLGSAGANDNTPFNNGFKKTENLKSHTAEAVKAAVKTIKTTSKKAKHTTGGLEDAVRGALWKALKVTGNAAGKATLYAVKKAVGK